MRKRFEQQLSFGQTLISEVKIMTRTRDALPALMHALQKIFVTPKYNEWLFSILEAEIIGDKKPTGRPGMDLWWIFVLAEVRLCIGASYDRLHYMANYDTLMRQIMGVGGEHNMSEKEFEYQNILDNVTMLDDDTVRKINEMIVSLGHDVFKKKDMVALHLKTDSYVVESNVHFPTDYNLLWDSARKCVDVIDYFKQMHHIGEWKKTRDWRRSLSGLMREVGKASSSGGKSKEERIFHAAAKYLEKAQSFFIKVQQTKNDLPIRGEIEIMLVESLEYYLAMLEKHIELLDRRLLRGEQIGHEEKVFSIFETYTEWITKGKLYPNVELGKKVLVTTDQYNLMVDYQVMDHQADSDVVRQLAKRILDGYAVKSWSFDKGFYSKENKEFLKDRIQEVVMPKKGKCNKAEQIEEQGSSFRKFRNLHSAVESNINELEHRGLNRCPDRGYEHFKRYVGLGVCAYNLHKIGKELIRQARDREKKERFRARMCA